MFGEALDRIRSLFTMRAPSRFASMPAARVQLTIVGEHSMLEASYKDGFEVDEMPRMPEC
jgi:hypothetical protein